MRRLLVDTHAVLWWLSDSKDLSATARSEIAEPASEMLVSVASAWEIAIKRALGKLRAPDAMPAAIEAAGFSWLAIAPGHAWAVSELPDHHRDPFDRLLIAQARAEDLPVLTADRRFRPYGIEVVW